MLPFNDALQSVMTTVQALPPHDRATIDAGGLVLAEAAHARWDMPRYDNSAMDGYAIDGLTCSEQSLLEIVGATYAGHPFSGIIAAGQTVRITTGATLPKGTNTVIPLEDAAEDSGQLRMQRAFIVGQHVRRQGEEFQYNEELLQAGTLLRAGEICLLASAGVDRVKIYPRPRVAIISTGDELVELGRVPGPGQIINSNLHYLLARLRECGCEPICIGIGKDNTTALDQLLSQALDADVILSTGGVSVGERDQVQSALSRRHFQKIFWKVAMKPGKPLLFGLLEGKLFFGLPGNPAATAATFELFVVPALKIIAGHQEARLQKRSGVLVEAVSGGGNRQIFLWCQLVWRNDRYEVVAQTRQGSGQNRSIQGANALLSVPVGTTQISQGERVEVLLIEACR